MASWINNPSRQLATGKRYLFDIQAPTTWSIADVQGRLASRGWTGISIDAQRDSNDALTGNMKAAATWSGAASTLPELDDPLVFGTIFLWYVPPATQPTVPPPAPAPTTPTTPVTPVTPATPSSNSTLLALLGLGIGAAAVGLLLAKRKK